MERILNGNTNTLHKASDDSLLRQTECGALTRVPDGQIERVEGAEIGGNRAPSRCGRCFSEGGGY